MKKLFNIFAITILVSIAAHKTVFCMDQEPEKPWNKRTADEAGLEENQTPAKQEALEKNSSALDQPSTKHIKFQPTGSYALDKPKVNIHPKHLINAICRGDVRAVEKLMHDGADMNAKHSYEDADGNKFTNIFPLLQAVICTNPKIVKLLLTSTTIDVNATCDFMHCNKSIAFSPEITLNYNIGHYNLSILKLLAVVPGFFLPNLITPILLDDRLDIGQLQQASEYARQEFMDMQSDVGLIRRMYESAYEVLLTALSKKEANAKQLFLNNPPYMSTTPARPIKWKPAARTATTTTTETTTEKDSEK